MGVSPIDHWQVVAPPSCHHCAPFPRRQLLPTSLEPIKRIQTQAPGATLKHISQSLDPTITRKPEVQPCSGLTFLLGSMGSPCCPLSDLVTLQPPVGKSHRELLSRGGDGAVRGRGARPKSWQQIRSQREEWKTVILLIYFYLYFFVYVCVCGEISYFFCGHTCPLLLLLSGMAHSECNVSKSFGKSFCWLHLGP